MAEHEEADGLHAERPGRTEVLDRDVGLGAVGRDPGDRGAGRVGVLQLVHRAEAGEHEDGDPGLGGLVDGRRDELHLVDLGEAVVEARAAQAVTVRDLDDLHAGPVEGVHDTAHLLLGELVAHGVRAVAQGGVGDPQVALAAGGGGVGEHVGLGHLVDDDGDVLGADGHVTHVRHRPSARRRRRRRAGQGRRRAGSRTSTWTRRRAGGRP